jgi:type II secretory pathway component GspD/PulD (secretin)
MANRLDKTMRTGILYWVLFALALVLAYALLTAGIFGQEATMVISSEQTKTSETEARASADSAKSGTQSPANTEKPGEGPKPAGTPGKPGETPAKPGEQPSKPGEQPGKPGEPAKSEAPKPVTRPDKPPKPPDPEELKVRPDKDGRVRFNFNGQPWQPVLEWLAENSGMSLDWQELPGDYLNLKSKQRYTIRETRDLINRHLLARGYTLLCQDEILSVANIKKLDPSLVPRVSPDELDRHDPHEFVKVSFPLDWLIAENVIDELKPMLSPNGKLTALKDINRLEAMDAAINLQEIRNLLRSEQSPDNQKALVREFPLQYAKASDVFEQLKTLLGGEVNKGDAGQGMPGGPQPGMNPEQQQAMIRAQQQQQQQQAGQPGALQPAKPKPQVTLVVNQRMNSILAHAPPDKMAIIAQAIEAIDVPLDTTQSLLNNVNRMQVYRLTGVDPEPVVKTLQEIGNLDPATRLQIDKKNKAIVAYATLADHVTIRSVVEKLSGSERRFKVIRLRRLAADYVAGSITFMMVGEKKKENTRRPYWMIDYGSQQTAEQNPNEFRVEADVEHNRLLLWANEIELGEVNNLLVQLGEIPAQGSRRETIRVIEARDLKDGEELLERIRRAWPSTAPNPLLINPPPDAEKSKSKSEDDKLHVADPATKSAELRGTQSDSLKLVQFTREEASREVSKSPAANSPPPVKITLDAQGRITVTSDDPGALDTFEELAAELVTPRKDYKVFKLTYAWAYGVALNLEDFFRDDEKKSQSNFWEFYYGYGQDDSKDDRSGRLSKRRPLKFISDSDSNTILVENADAAQLKTIEELINLYDQPPPSDSQSVRKTETIHLEYSKAKVVAETVKDVYRDLLSANDRALQGAKNDRDSGRTFIYEFSTGDDGKKEQKMPKFKGQLSIGVDELSNSLAISAPAYLFDQVHKMVKDLDAAAAPTSTVRVVKLGQGVSGQQAQEAIANALGEGGSARKSQQGQNANRQQPRNRQQSGGNRNRSSGNSSSK